MAQRKSLDWFSSAVGGWPQLLANILLMGLVSLCFVLTWKVGSLTSSVRTIADLSALRIALVEKSDVASRYVDRLGAKLGSADRAELKILEVSYQKKDWSRAAESAKSIADSIETQMIVDQMKLSRLGLLGLTLGVMVLFLRSWILRRGRAKFELEFVRPLQALASHWDQAAQLSDSTKSEFNFKIEELQSLQKAYSEMALRVSTHLSQELSSTRVATLGEMASSLAREVGGPLTNIKMYAERGMSHGDADSKNALSVILSNVLRIEKLVESTLSFAKDSHNLKKDIFSLSVPIEGANKLLRVLIESHGIEYTVDVPKNLKVAGTESQLEQVFYHLLSNAREAVESAQEAKVKVLARGERVDNRDWIVCEIIDNGPGIDPKNEKKVWDPFFTTRKKGEGTGLGLSIVRQIIEAHHGTVQYFRRDNQTVFELRFPAHGPIGS